MGNYVYILFTNALNFYRVFTLFYPGLSEFEENWKQHDFQLNNKSIIPINMGKNWRIKKITPTHKGWVQYKPDKIIIKKGSCYLHCLVVIWFIAEQRHSHECLVCNWIFVELLFNKYQLLLPL